MRSYVLTLQFSLNFPNCLRNVFLKAKHSVFCTPKYFYTSMDVMNITEEDKTPKVIKEGSAEILETPERKVFYNPVQEFNRDLSVLVLQIFSKEFQKSQSENKFITQQKDFKILEALSASGLRSIRYGKEVPNVSQVIANDISEIAAQNIEKNIKHNKVEHIVQASQSDAVSFMFNHHHPSKRFQAVDLDPYGSPAMFLDSAIQCIADGGILMVTCTDTALLCGNFPESCYLRYGALSLKIQAMHEMGIRIVLQSIQSHASRYKRYIVPVLSVSVDFYIRVFVKIYSSGEICKSVASKLSMVYQCNECDSVTLQPLAVQKKSKKNDKSIFYVLPNGPPVDKECIHCKGKFHMGGPIWNGPIHDQKFVAEMLKSSEINEFNTSKRLIGMLNLIQEELVDVPLYFVATAMCKTLRCVAIPMMTLRSAILNSNYRVSFSHASKLSLKTDAPASFIWDLHREWVNQNPIKPKNIKPGSPADTILKTPVQNKIDFSLRPDANPLSRQMKLTRYQVNPLPFWGPGSKSTTMNLIENPKKLKNQNKRKLGKKNSEDNNTENKIVKLDPLDNS